MPTAWKTGAILAIAACVSVISCARAPQYDIVLRNGRICDGTDVPCFSGGVAVAGDSIARVGELGDAHGRTDIDVRGQVIAPALST